MTFTDDDLKRIKVACLLSVEEYGNKEAKEILALIARLEAAELIVMQGEHEHGWRQEYVAWRKTKGDTGQPRPKSEAELAELQRRAFRSTAAGE